VSILAPRAESACRCGVCAGATGGGVCVVSVWCLWCVWCLCVVCVCVCMIFDF
jgi:hypothetical protein